MRYGRSLYNDLTPTLMLTSSVLRWYEVRAAHRWCVRLKRPLAMRRKIPGVAAPSQTSAQNQGFFALDRSRLARSKNATSAMGIRGCKPINSLLETALHRQRNPHNRRPRRKFLSPRKSPREHAVAAGAVNYPFLTQFHNAAVPVPQGQAPAKWHQLERARGISQ